MSISLGITRDERGGVAGHIFFCRIRANHLEQFKLCFCISSSVTEVAKHVLVVVDRINLFVTNYVFE